jgi:hypothetical protein
MIDIGVDGAGRVVVIKMTGLISEAEIVASTEELTDTFESETLHRVLLDWQDLEGWEKGAKIAGTWAGMRHWANIRQVAVIADTKWEDEILRIADIYRAADVRRFPPEQREAALAWLAGQET